MTTRRDFLRAGLAAGIGTGLLPRALGADASDRRPNILFVFSDDHAAQAISAYGSRINATPNIDRLAKDGVLFENCFCANSICGPSRATVLTGKFSHKNGFLRNGNRFDGDQQTYPKLLRDAGYQTAMIGKWHLASDPTGFDYWKILPGQGSYYNPDFLGPEGRERIEGYTTDIITDLSLDWLKSKRDPNRPFLLHCWHKAPHRNWMPGPKYLNKYDGETKWEPPTLFDDYSGRTSSASRHEMGIGPHMNLPTDLKVTEPLTASGERLRGEYGRMTDEQKKAWDQAYAAKNEEFRRENPTGDALVRWKYQRYIKDYLRCIDSVDESVGRLLDYLEEAGLAENTIVAYSSDQGFYLGEHGWFDKRWMYEESLRMPMLMRWPGKVKPGTRVRNMVQNIDFGPSFLDAVGGTVPDDMQGESFWPVVRDDRAPWRQSIYYHYYEFPGAHSVQKHCGVRTDRYKLIHFYPVAEWELFDLRKDPMEMKSVYDDPAYSGVVREMKAELQRLQAKYADDSMVVPPVPAPPDLSALGVAHAQRVTGLRKTDAGWLMTGADSDGAVALFRTEKPFTRRITVRGTVQTAVTEGVANGFLAVAPAGAPDRFVRGGIYIRAGQYLIQDGTETLADHGARFDAAKRFDVALTVDLRARTITTVVDGTPVEAKLPDGWTSIGYVGFSLNRTTTAFSPLAVDGE